MSLTRKQVRLLLLSAEDHEALPDDSQEKNDETFGSNMTKEEVKVEMKDQVDYLRKRFNKAKKSKVVERAIQKDREFKANSPKHSSPVKSIKSGSPNQTKEEVQTARDLINLARKNGSGISMANNRKAAIKRK